MHTSYVAIIFFCLTKSQAYICFLLTCFVSHPELDNGLKTHKVFVNLVKDKINYISMFIMENFFIEYYYKFFFTVKNHRRIKFKTPVVFLILTATRIYYIQINHSTF